MNIQILPNWFKKVALIVFIVSSILSGGDDFIAGWNDAQNNKKMNFEQTNHNQHYFTNMIGGEKVIHWIAVLATISLLTYMISKEKVEDDYIKLIRLESYQLAFLILVVLSLLSFIINKKFLSDLDDSVNLFMLLYLVVFYIKKRLA